MKKQENKSKDPLYFCIDGWVDKKDMVHTPMEYYLATRKKERVPLTATWMEFEGIKWNKSEQERQKEYDFTHLWTLQTKQNKNKLIHKKNRLVVTRREGVWRVSKMDGDGW